MDTVREFISDHRVGPLWVCTGFLSGSGLAFLAEHTPKREVALLTTELSVAFQGQVSAEHAERVDDWLADDRVTVHTWHRRGTDDQPRADMHIKAFVANPHDRKGAAALVGSANLTWTGLAVNAELMTLVAASEVPRVVRHVSQLMGQPSATQKATQKTDLRKRVQRGRAKTGQSRQPSTGRAAKRGRTVQPTQRNQQKRRRSARR